MILQALYEHYQRLLADDDADVAVPGFSPAKVTHALVLEENGELVDILPLTHLDGKRMAAVEMKVPEQTTRTSGVKPFLLCDKPAYVLGLMQKKNEKPVVSKHEYDAFRDANASFLKKASCPAAEAVIRFLDSWNPEVAMDHPIVMQMPEIIQDSNRVVFKIDGVSGYLHDDPFVMQAWARMQELSVNPVLGQCLVTGEVAEIAKLHPAIKGVVGAQVTGAMLVSYNAAAFTSYGKSQSYNAPVSSNATFAYATVLNYLLSKRRNRIRLADTTIIFWADKPKACVEETVFSWSLDPVDPAPASGDEKERSNDAIAIEQARTILTNLKDGKPAGIAEFDAGTRCYLLGLAPNAARLSIRIWQVSTFGSLLENVAQHYRDMEVAGGMPGRSFVSPYWVLKSLATQEDSDNIPPLMGGQLLKSIVEGRPYPQTLYQAALRRCRSGGDHGGVNHIRAGVIKACLLRKYRLDRKKEKEEEITMALNEQNRNTGYQLGRLFSVLEKAQRDALGTGINATIRDRYFGAASATPGSVFPLLLRLSRHHLSKAKYGNFLEAGIQSILNAIEAFPAHLSFEDQGQFMLGYYHQNQANYMKKADNGDDDNQKGE